VGLACMGLGPPWAPALLLRCNRLAYDDQVSAKWTQTFLKKWTHKHGARFSVLY